MSDTSTARRSEDATRLALPAEPSSTTQPIRILHLIKGLGPGGAEQLLLQQARQRDRMRFEYQVAYTVAEKHHLVGPLAELDVVARCLTKPGESGRRWLLRLRAALTDVDVVHVHSPLLAAAARSVAQTIPASRRPSVITTEHNRWPRHNRYTRFANHHTIRFDDHTLAVSDDVAATMDGRDDIEVLVHGIDLSATAALAGERAAVRAEFGIGDNEVVIGTVANFRREKAYDVMLAAAAMVTAADPSVRYLLVGQGPLAEEVHRLHERLGLGDRVILTGYRPDATRVTAAFDVFTLASRHEGLPVSLMDALALGVPVAATKAGGIPQAITDGVEGLLVHADDPEALAAVHLRLAADPALRATMGANAAFRADDFDARRTTTHLESIYRRFA